MMHEDGANKMPEKCLKAPPVPRWTRRRFGRAALAAGGAAMFSSQLGARTLWPASKKQKQVAAPSTSSQHVSGPDSLRAHAAARGLLYGAAINPALLDLDGMSASGTTDGYTQLVGAQCGILVAENAMKWSAMRPSPDQFDFSQADKLLRFADLMGQRVRGHNLCWHEALPAWFQSTATKQNAQKLLVEHIQTVAGHFRGRLQSWDVVNEAVEPNDSRPDGLRRTPWLDLLGPGYIELAFQTAAQADPAAKLVYNDYGIELDTPEQIVKRGQVLLLVRRLKARGVPIHAVGVQSHLKSGDPQPGQGLVAFIRDVAKLGLDVYITEMDVRTSDAAASPEAEDSAVAKVYEDYLTKVLEEPNVPVALTWGLVNGQSWLNSPQQNPNGAPQRPLPFDDGLNPTATFFALRNAIDKAHVTAIEPSAKPSANPAPDDLYKPFTVPGSPTAKPASPGPQG
jgi:endo-1,4-beta-xylanase